MSLPLSPESRDLLKRILPFPLFVTATTFVFAYLTFLVSANQLPASWYGIWERWDTVHYLKIAKDWYSGEPDAIRMVFLPFYPWLSSLIGRVTGDYLLALLIVSNIAYLVSCGYLYKLALLDLPEESAFRSVVYYSIFPTAYFLHAGYADVLFLALTIPAFYYARTGKWWVAAVLGMFASATRIYGVFLLPVFIVERLIQDGYKQWRRSLPVLVPLALIPLGLLAYLAINYQYFGNPFQFQEFYRNFWGKTLALPTRGFWDTWNGIFNRNPAERVMVSFFELVAGLFAMAYAGYSILRARDSYALYIVLMTALMCGSTFWAGSCRYLLALFPLFIDLPRWLKRENRHHAFVFLSLIFYGFFLNQFIQGRWAF